MEEGGDLFLNLGCVSVMSPKQIHDIKLIPFALTTCNIFAFVSDLSMRCT